MKKLVAILFGGQSSEHEVSCVSAANVAENIDKTKFDLLLVGITKDGKWWIFDGTTEDMRAGKWLDDPKNLVPAVLSPCSAHHGFAVFDKAAGTYEIKRVDVIFPVLHGKNGEDGTMQGLLELSGVPYVGCDTCSSAMGMDKSATKLVAENAGVPVVPFITAVRSPAADINALVCESEERFGYPMFVKPAQAGSSVGITKATDRATLLEGIELAFRHDKKLLIEPDADGREIEVAVLGNHEVIASPCGEIVPNSDFYDYDTKYINDSADCIAPAELEPETNDLIRELAKKVYVALGCSGLSRVDFFLTKDGPLFNEINTIPGFTPISMFPKLMALEGISYSRLITRLLTLAEERS